MFTCMQHRPKMTATLMLHVFTKTDFDAKLACREECSEKTFKNITRRRVVTLVATRSFDTNKRLYLIALIRGKNRT